MLHGVAALARSMTQYCADYAKTPNQLLQNFAQCQATQANGLRTFLTQANDVKPPPNASNLNTALVNQFATFTTSKDEAQSIADQLMMADEYTEEGQALKDLQADQKQIQESKYDNVGSLLADLQEDIKESQSRIDIMNNLHQALPHLLYLFFNAPSTQ